MLRGVAGAVTSSDEVKLVPAIAPIPVSDVNEQYGRAEPVERPKKEEAGPKYEELVEERIKEVAFKKSMPYQPEVALFKGGLVKRETIAKVGEKEPEVVTPVKNYAESVELVYKQGAALLISSSLGFLDTLPPSKGKSTIKKEANRLAAIFGIVNTLKPQKTIGLSSKLEWWGGTGTSGGGGKTESSKDGGSKSRKPSKEEEEEISKGSGSDFLKNTGLVLGAGTLFGAGYYIPKAFPNTVRNKTDNVVDDFKEQKLLEKTTDEEGNPKELSEYEQILAEREALEETREELLKELEGVSFEKRSARYRCVIVFTRFKNDPFPLISMGSWEGFIAESPKGTNGFGYDPIFFLPKYGKTSAELTDEEKNSISHRAIALKGIENYFVNQHNYKNEM